MPVIVTPQSQVYYSIDLRNARLELINTMMGAGGGTITLFGGSIFPRPEDITFDQPLAVFQCSPTFSEAASGAILNVNPIATAYGTEAANEGTPATWGRLSTSSGVPLVDFTVGDQYSQAAMKMSPDNIIVANQEVNITGMSFSAGN